MSDRCRPSSTSRTVGALLLAGVLAVGCADREPAVRTVDVDGGEAGVALLGNHPVGAEPGEVVRIAHASPRAEGNVEAPVAHAFVAAGDGPLPPLFVGHDAGASPNPGVWGHCRGGPAEAAVDGCPVPPVEGPDSWDGASYWSTGAVLPGEEADVRLDEDIPDGTYRLVCALHPELTVELAVGGDPDDARPVDQAELEAALTRTEEETAPATVLAGVQLAEPAAFVYRFVPEQVTVRVGEPVTWISTGRAPVDVVFGDDHLSLSHTEPGDALAQVPSDAWDGEGELRSGYLSADGDSGAAADRFTVVFAEPGTYPYATRFADTMSGEVIVEP